MKKFLIAFLVMTTFILIDLTECRRKRRRVDPLKDTTISYLKDRRLNKNTPTHNPRVNLKFVKGVIHIFMTKLGVTLKDIDKALRMPIINYSRIMTNLRDVISGHAKPEHVKILGELFNKEYKGWAEATKDESKIKDAIEEVKPYIHPSKIISRRQGDKPKDNRRRRIRRFR